MISDKNWPIVKPSWQKGSHCIYIYIFSYGLAGASPRHIKGKNNLKQNNFIEFPCGVSWSDPLCWKWLCVFGCITTGSYQMETTSLTAYYDNRSATKGVLGRQGMTMKQNMNMDMMDRGRVPYSDILAVCSCYRKILQSNTDGLPLIRCQY